MFSVASGAFSSRIHIVASATTKATIERVMDLFKTHGVMEHLVSDNGTSFTATVLWAFCAQNGVHHSTLIPVRPDPNSLAERMEQTFKQGIKKMTAENDSLMNNLAHSQMKYNVIPHTTGCTPAKWVFNRQLRQMMTLRLDLFLPRVDVHVNQEQKCQRSPNVAHIMVFLPMIWCLQGILDKRIHGCG